MPATHQQSLISIAPAFDEVSFGHPVHSISASELHFLDLYLPAPHSIEQSTHLPDPATVLYLPGGHCVHGPPSSPSKPALHLQSVLLPWALPCVWELRGQSIQEGLGSTKFRYVLGAHGEQSCPSPSGPYVPALHLQTLTTVFAPGSEVFPLGQDLQVISCRVVHGEDRY